MSGAALSFRTLLLAALWVAATAPRAHAQTDPLAGDPPDTTSATDDYVSTAAPTREAPRAPEQETEPASDAEPAADEEDDDEVVHEPHRHAIFAYPYSLLRRGIVLGYEYAVPDTRLGLIVEYSFERRARGDFRSTASGFGLGWRFYFMGKSRFGNFRGRACVGPFIGGMGSLRIVGVREADGRDAVGRATRATAEGQLGVRFPIRAKAELSMLATAGLNTDFVGGLALQLRPSVGFALTVGMLL